MSSATAPSNDHCLVRALDAAFRAWQRGELTKARQLLVRTLTVAEASCNTAAMLQAHQMLGHVALVRGDLRMARQHHRAVLRGSRAAGLTLGVASSLHNLGLVAAGEGRRRRACALIAAAVTIYTRLGRTAAAAEARANLERIEAAPPTTNVDHE
jgi:hypothetical protein